MRSFPFINAKYYLLPLLAFGFFTGLVNSESPKNQIQNYEDIFYSSMERQCALVFLSTLFNNQGLDKNGLPLMMRLPNKVRSALVNEVVDWVIRNNHSKADADLILLHILKFDPIPNFRSRAASGIQCADPQVAVPGLVAAFQDRSSRVRLFACQTLFLRRSREAVDDIIPLLDDKDEEVRGTAIRALGNLSGREALPKIRELYQAAKKKKKVSWIFPDAFARLGDYELAIKSAGPFLADSNWNIRYFAVEALSFVKTKKVVRVLIKGLPIVMRLELQDWQNHGVRSKRIVNRMYKTLSERTGQDFGNDPKKWLDWWLVNHKAYGVEDYKQPKDFATLLKRYKSKRPEKEIQVSRSYNTVLEFTKKQNKDKLVWSETVNGLRALLIAMHPATDEGQNIYLMLVLQNVSKKSIPVGPISLNSHLKHPKYAGKIQEPKDFIKAMRLEKDLAPRDCFFLVIRLVVMTRKGVKKVAPNVKEFNQAYILRRTVRMLHFLSKGSYQFRLTYQGDGLLWKGKSLVTPPVQIQVND